MSRVIIKSLKKQLKRVLHQPFLEPTQKQNGQQVQPIGNELVNASTMDVTQRGKSQ
jgi:hypothetical protein